MTRRVMLGYIYTNINAQTVKNEMSTAYSFNRINTANKMNNACNSLLGWSIVTTATYRKHFRKAQISNLEKLKYCSLKTDRQSNICIF